MRVVVVALLCGCGRINIVAPPPCEQLAFKRAPDIGAFAPRNVALARLDGDRNLDLIMTSGDTGTVDVALGNGDGTFRPPVTHASGVHPWALAAGSLAPGAPVDFVVGNFDSNTLAVFRNDGSGGFQLGTLLTTPPSPQAVALQDFDGDGRLDLVAANFSSDKITVYANDGARGFIAAGSSYPTAAGPYSIASDDLNQDGIQDLLVATVPDNAVSSFLGNGNGTFQPLAPISLGAQSQAWHVTTTDLDRDGHTDAIVALNYGASMLALLRGRGDGTFDAPVLVPSGYNPWWVVAGDLTGDDSVELVVASGPDGVSVYMGHGDGTFEPRQDFLPAEGEKICVATGDLDGDRRLDIVTANGIDNTVSVLLNACY